jgi:hypothetical protein
MRPVVTRDVDMIIGDRSYVVDRPPVELRHAPVLLEPEDMLNAR